MDICKFGLYAAVDFSNRDSWLSAELILGCSRISPNSGVTIRMKEVAVIAFACLLAYVAPAGLLAKSLIVAMPFVYYQERLKNVIVCDNDTNNEDLRNAFEVEQQASNLRELARQGQPGVLAKLRSSCAAVASYVQERVHSIGWPFAECACCAAGGANLNSSPVGAWERTQPAVSGASASSDFVQVSSGIDEEEKRGVQQHQQQYLGETDDGDFY